MPEIEKELIFMKSVSKLLALLLCVAMMACCMPCAFAQEESPVGYFTGSIVDLTCFYHFYENGTYYAVFFDGGVKEFGAWEVRDEGTEYYAELQVVDGETVPVEESKTVSEKTIHTVNTDGTELDLPWDHDALCDFTAGGRSLHATFTFDKDYDDPKGLEKLMPVVVKRLYANNKDTRTLTLLHTGEFADFTGDESCEGTWVADDQGVYTLTTADGKTFTVTPLEDGTYAYAGAGDEANILTDYIKVAYKFQQKLTEEDAGAFTIAAGTGAEDFAEAISGLNGQPAKAVLKCDALNGTWELNLSIDAPALGSPELTLMSGTYSEEPDPEAFGYFPILTFTADNGSVFQAVGGEFALTGIDTAQRPYTLPIQMEGLETLIRGAIPVKVALNLNLEYTLNITL